MDIAQSGLTDSPELNSEAVRKQLQVAEDFLLDTTTMGERTAYKECKWSARKIVHAYLENRVQEINLLSEEKQKKKQEHEIRVDLYNAADILFHFFLPWRFDKDAPTIGKFWGAVQSLVEVSV
jgi:hypothetical protein